MGDTSTRTEEGMPKVYVTHRPDGTTTKFVGARDNEVEAGCARILFNMTSTDTSKSVDMTFSSDVYLKDGMIVPKDGPLGAYLDVEIFHPVAGFVDYYCRKVPIFGSTPLPLNSEDRQHIPAGLIIRLTVYNSDGTGEQDAAADFQMAGWIELFR